MAITSRHVVLALSLDKAWRDKCKMELLSEEFVPRRGVLHLLCKINKVIITLCSNWQLLQLRYVLHLLHPVNIRTFR